MPELDLDELLAAYQRASPPVRAKPSPPKPGLNGLLLPDSSQERINEAEMILEAATVHHKPSHLFLLFSGGHDSLATTHLSFLLLQNTLRQGSPVALGERSYPAHPSSTGRQTPQRISPHPVDSSTRIANRKTTMRRNSHLLWRAPRGPPASSTISLLHAARTRHPAAGGAAYRCLPLQAQFNILPLY